jgi:hypothetical protein
VNCMNGEREEAYIRVGSDGAVDHHLGLRLSLHLHLRRHTRVHGRHGTEQKTSGRHSRRNLAEGGSGIASDGDGVLEGGSVASLLVSIPRGARGNHGRRADRGCDLAQERARYGPSGSRRDSHVREVARIRKTAAESCVGGAGISARLFCLRRREDRRRRGGGGRRRGRHLRGRGGDVKR